jgi:hypothetical protein
VSVRPCPRVDYREVADPADSRPAKVRPEAVQQQTHVEPCVKSPVESAWYQRLKLRYDELPPNFAFNFNMSPSAKAPRRAVRPYVVKLTTPSTFSALGVHGLASTSTLGNVHVQVAQGGRASPKHSFQPECC